MPVGRTLCYNCPPNDCLFFGPLDINTCIEGCVLNWSEWQILQEWKSLAVAKHEWGGVPV